MNYILYHVHLHDLQRLQLFRSQDLTLAQMFCRFLPASGDSLTGGFIQWWFPWGLNRHFWWFCESFTSEDFLGCRWWVMLGGCAGVKLLLGFLRIVRTGIPINQAAFRAESRVEHCWNVWNWHMIFGSICKTELHILPWRHISRCHSKQQKTMKNTVTVSDINLSLL
jgi:hypothetical protein